MKKLKFALIPVLFLLALSFGLCFALSKFYTQYEAMQKSIETSLEYPPDAANAIKHATAASDMYSMLRVALGDALAEKAVIKLGVMNEYLEQKKYPNDQDSAREIMKDLHNNFAGIEAARIAAMTGDKVKAFEIILSFADSSTLIVNRSYNPFFESKEPKKDVVSYGQEWFDAHQEEIEKRIQKKLNRARILPQELSQDKPLRMSSLNGKASLIE